MSSIMKKNLLYWAVALCALPLLLAACSQQDNEPINVEGELVPLEISVSADTRTIIDSSTLPDLTSFGIFGVTQETGELQEDIENVSVEYVKGECTLSRDVLLDERPTFIYSYYPYDETATLNSVPVSMNGGATDYLYGCSYNLATGANTTVNNAQPHATIYFKHALAQVRLIAYKTADYEGDAFVASFVVNGVPLHGTMDATTGSITATEWGDMTFKVTDPSNLHVEGEGTTTYRFLAIPTEDVLDRMMQIEGATGVMVQPMLKGTELFIGAKYEEKFGHVVLCGLGGIFVEVLKDVSSGLAPLTYEEAYSMIHSLRAYKIIRGTRGQQGVNEDRFAEIIVRLSTLLRFATEIKEMDINPLLGTERHVIAVDARIRVEKRKAD